MDMEQTLRIVDKHFGAISRGGIEQRVSRTEEPVQTAERRIVSESSGYISALIAAYKTPAATHEDAAALGQLAFVLSYGKNSRLWRRLTDRGLTTSARTWTSTTRDPSLFFIEALLVPTTGHEEVEAIVDKEIDGIKQHGVTEEEAGRARNQLRAFEAFRRDGTFGIASALNEAIASGDWKLYTTLPDRLRTVTRADIQRVARRYLRNESRTIAWHKPKT